MHIEKPASRGCCVVVYNLSKDCRSCRTNVVGKEGFTSCRRAKVIAKALNSRFKDWGYGHLSAEVVRNDFFFDVTLLPALRTDSLEVVEVWVEQHAPLPTLIPPDEATWWPVACKLLPQRSTSTN